MDLSNLIDFFLSLWKVESAPVAPVETTPAEVEVTPAPEVNKVTFNYLIVLSKSLIC